MGDETARGRRRFGKYRSFRDFFEEAERERGREGEDRRKKNGYSVIHVGRGVRIATREGKKGARRLIVSFARRIGTS